MASDTAQSLAQQLGDLSAAWSWDQTGPRERRSNVRRPFSAAQLIAPFYGSLPCDNQWEQVRGHNLSVRGLSFFSNHWPTHETIVCKFELTDETLFLTAIVYYVKRIITGKKLVNLVGCRFLNRLDVPGAS